MADLDPLGLFPKSIMAEAARQGQSRFYSTDSIIAPPTNTLQAGTGMFVLTGESMTLATGYPIQVGVGAFAMNSPNTTVTLTYTSSVPPFSLTPTDNATDNTAQTTYTFGGKNFALGVAQSSRVIAFAVSSRATTFQNISSITLTPNAGGPVSAIFAERGVNALNGAEIWYASVPSGTTGTISLVYAGAGTSRSSIQLYSIISPLSAAPAVHANSIANAPTAALVVPSGGAAIGGAFSSTGGPGTPTATPAGFNNLDLNANPAGANQMWAMHANAGFGTGSSQTLTMTLTGASSVAAAFAAWGP